MVNHEANTNFFLLVGASHLEDPCLSHRVPPLPATKLSFYPHNDEILLLLLLVIPDIGCDQSIPVSSCELGVAASSIKLFSVSTIWLHGCWSLHLSILAKLLFGKAILQEHLELLISEPPRDERSAGFGKGPNSVKQNLTRSPHACGLRTSWWRKEGGVVSGERMGGWRDYKLG